MKYDFFITYHDDDEMAARWIAAVFKEEGFSTISESWVFLPGDTTEEKLLHTFETCRGLIVILSNPIIQSGFTPEAVRGVLEIASSNELIFFIPVLIRPCSLPGVWGSIAVMNLVGVKEEEARRQLIKAAAGRAGKESIPESPQLTGKTIDDILKKREKEYKELLVKTIKKNYHMKLDLEQEIEKVVEVKNERTGEIEKRKEWVWEKVDLETVLTDRNDYILVNPSGMGKTTFLTYAACALLDPAKNYSFVPLFTTCFALNNREGSIETFLTKRLDSFYYNSEIYVIDSEWENLCLLIDALDQAKNVDDIVSSLQLQEKYGHYKKAKIILSSRQNTADRVREGFRRIRLQLPEEDEILHYLGEESYKKLESLIASSRELIAVPVLLEMLKTISERGHISSKLVNRSGLYTEFTRILIDQERRKPRFWSNASFIRHFIDLELEKVLENIAFFSLVDNEILEIEKEKLLKYCESVEKKEALLNIGIILEFFEDREQKIVFRHQSFQAYFAARYMYYRNPDLFQKLTGDIRFFYSDVWYEVMRFFVGLEKKPEKAANFIDFIWKREDEKEDLFKVLKMFFAFFLATDTPVSYYIESKLCDRLREFLSHRGTYWYFFIDHWSKLNRSNDDHLKPIVSLLKSFLRDENEMVRQFSVLRLVDIGKGININILEPLLKDESDFVLSAAAEALGNIGTERNIPLLIPLLKSRNSWVRFYSTRALGKLFTWDALRLFRPLLTDTDWRLQSAVTSALEEFFKVENIFLLESLLNDENKNICNTANEVLKRIVEKKDICLLEKLVSFKNDDVRNMAVKALGEIGSYEHFNLIKSLLRSENKDLSRIAAYALENIIKNNRHLLEPLLRDENDYIRSAAAKALHKIVTTKDIYLLEPLLSDENPVIRKSAVLALEKIGTSNNITLLEPLISDENYEIRNAVAHALGKIITVKDIHLLELLLKDENKWVRLAAMSELEKIGTLNHVSLIAPLLRDEDENVRIAAAHALGKIRTSRDFPIRDSRLSENDRNAILAKKIGTIRTTKDIPKLKPLLMDKNAEVRSEAVCALGNIGTAEHIPLLKPILKDKSKNVRRATVEALGKIGTEKDIPLLKSLFRDKKPVVRCTAIEVFVEIGSNKDILLPEFLFRDPDINVRITAINALKKINTSVSIPLLVSLLKTRSVYILNTVIEILGVILKPFDINLLLPLLRNKKGSIRELAAKALLNHIEAKDISLIAPLLRDKHFIIRRIGVEILGKVGSEKDLNLLMPLISDKDKPVCKAAIQALCKIVAAKDIHLFAPLLKNENPDVCVNIAKTLGDIGAVEHISLLEPLLKDENLSIRLAATDAIEAILKRSAAALRFTIPKSNKSILKQQSFITPGIPPLRVLHISDIHYSQQCHQDIGRIFQQFLRDLTKWRQQPNNEKIHAVCLTGDIAQSGKDTQYDSINENINTILSTAGCSNDDLFMVPGNHDVQDYDILSHQGQQILKDAWTDQDNINFNVLNNFQNYREFHEKFTNYYGFIKKYGYQSSITETYGDDSKPWYSRKLKDYPVRIIGLNSALFGIKGFHEYGKLRMGTNQFTEAYSRNPANGEIVILLTHHPLNWMYETEYEEFSTLFERHSVVHLHGHIHRLKIHNLFSFSGSSYLSVGTGSIYGAKGTKDINTYHILTFDFEKKEIHICARRWNPDMERWTNYDNETWNTFPFPQVNIYINQAVV